MKNYSKLGQVLRAGEIAEPVLDKACGIICNILSNYEVLIQLIIVIVIFVCKYVFIFLVLWSKPNGAERFITIGVILPNSCTCMYMTSPAQLMQEGVKVCGS